MTEKILFALALALFFMIPSIILIEGALRETKEKKLNVNALRLNITGTIFSGFVCLLLFVVGIGMIYASLMICDKLAWGLILFIPLGIFLSLDFPLFVNHLFHELSRTVIIDKLNNTVIVQKLGIKDIINLVTDKYQVIRYEPPWQGGGRGRPPGAEFGKTVIIKDNKKFEFSDIILTNYDLFLTLNDNKNLKTIKRQINFIT